MRTKQTEGVAPLEFDKLADRQKALRSLMNRINTDKKYQVIAMADDVVSPYFLRRPSGIMQLDVDTGGGLPAGGVSMVSGPDNAGKSFLLYKYMAFHQRLYGNKSFLGIAPVEGALDYFFMRKVGVRIAVPDEMIEERERARKLRGGAAFTKAERAELKDQVGQVVVMAGKNGEDLLDVVHEATRDNIFGIIGIDSFTALLPEAYAKQETLHEDGRRASHATLSTNFFQRMYPFLIGMWGRNDTTIICTQQVRSNPKKAEAPGPMQKYIRDWAPAGAYGAKHGKMIDLLVWGGEKERAKSGQEKGQVTGKWINWETMKGKAGTHDNIRGDVEFSYETLTDDLREVITTGIRYKAVVEVDGYLSLVNQSTGEVVPTLSKLAGIDRFIKMMQDDFNIELQVRREVLAAAGIECAYQ